MAQSQKLHPNYINKLYPNNFANGLRDRGSIPAESYQRLKKRYLMPPCLALSTIR